MNVLLLTMDEPMYMPQYIEPILRARGDHISEVVIAPHPGEGLPTIARQRYKMFGPIDFLRYGTKFGTGKLLAQLPAEIDRALTGRCHSVPAVANQYDIPVRTETDINRPGFVSRIEDMDPDLILSVSCGQLVKEDLLSIPEYGSINVHGSLLPKHRGRAASFWALYEGDDESGVTAHYMTDEFDDGDIVMQREFDIVSNDTMDSVYRKVSKTGANLVVDLLDEIEDGEITTTPNRTEEGEYRSLPGKEARREFKQRGNEFL
ncbi:methionyl-tRNA formyltransferase [Halococcus thailandensis]|uniref:Formyl transferase-like protein n=1 Tax=Halococcus thailandensis JCM 13552 TaxID=1227457 RepID=M0MUU8_9EURY|nr:formyltransferase family protein [Halococcus thailandensis]EMA48235.1 Formyl transferase-like protein [Halococcus thailandensis JCM 13552]